MKYDETNVTKGNRADGENPGYFYAPCWHCGKRLNVGNYPPVIIRGQLNVWCSGHEPSTIREQGIGGWNHALDNTDDR